MLNLDARTVLMQAAQKGHLVAYLTIDSQRADLNAKDKEGETVLTLGGRPRQ